MRFRDFPKGDARRVFLVLLAVEGHGDKASAYYIAKALECSRADIYRAMTVAEQQFGVRLARENAPGRTREGTLIRVADWGALRPTTLRELLAKLEPVEG